MTSFADISENPGLFWGILPTDWCVDIVPVWDKYGKTSKIYGIYHNEKLVGGGIVFTEVSPDMMYNKKEAIHWFKKGFLYIGFLWVNENQRGKQLGSFWLQELYKLNTGQKFWLTIEDHNLVGFYGKNGFRFEKKLFNNDGEEWLLIKS